MEKDIKKIRNHVNMSQRKFADYFNIPLGTFRNWEQEISKPPEYVLNMIIESIRRDKMINVETIKFVKMLNTLATLTKGGIFEFKNATENDYNSGKIFYDERGRDKDGNYRIVLDMCIVDDKECIHHDVVSYYDSNAEDYIVRAVINEDDRYIIVKFLNSEDEVVVENGRWYFA